MHPSFAARARAAALFGMLVLALVALVLLARAPRPVAGAVASATPAPAFLPLLRSPEPTPTPIVVGPPPQFLKLIELPDAECPNVAGFNPTSGYMYVVNNYSYNVSVFKDTEHIDDIYTGEWPTLITSEPNSARTYVTNLHTGLSILEGVGQVALVPKDFEPYGVAYNPVNGLVYVSDLDSQVQIIQGATSLKTLELQDPDTGGGSGWMRAIVADPVTGRVYTASWDYGQLYVIEGTEVVDVVRVGWGPLNMALDPERRLLTIAHSDPNAAYPHDITVVNVDTLEVTPIDTRPLEINSSRDVALDPLSGYAYVSNTDIGTVTILDGTQVIGVQPAGTAPWGVGVNPNNGYAFVANSGSNNVTILRNGQVVSTVATVGRQPVAIGVDTLNNDVYVVNRGRQTAIFDCRQASVTVLR